jgi:hypothetical protein
MPKFMAAHPVAYNKDQLEQLAKEQPPAGVSWVSYCEWDAPDKQTVEGIFKQYNIPHEAIYEVQHFNPQTGDFD